MIPDITVTRSPEETKEAARELAGSLQPGDVIALSGELGSGKTTFVQGLAEQLEVRGVVNSPTFKLVGEFEGRVRLYHVDFFRIKSPNELLKMGLEHYLYGEGITVIEWADRFPEFIPESAFDIRFTTLSPFDREITIAKPDRDESSGY